MKKESRNLARISSNAELCNGHLIAVTEHGIHIKRYNGIDNNGCHNFKGWKYFAKRDFTPEHKYFEFSQMKYFIHDAENNWPEIAKKKMNVSDKKIAIEKDFEHENG